MKILWFTNKFANADEYYGSHLSGTGGWLKALDLAIQNQCELNVAFYHKSQQVPFQYKNTTYYPILQRNRSKLSSYLFNRFSRITDREDIEKYLDIINKVQPDIIHIHGTERPFGRILEKVDIPCVISIQGNITVVSHMFKKGLSAKHLNASNSLFHSLAGIRQFKIEYKRFIKKSEIEQKILAKSKYIIGRTRWDIAVSRVFAPRAIYYHADEILRTEFYSNRWKPNEITDTFHIFTTTSNTYYKGFETICESLSLLNKTTAINLIWRVAGISADDLIVKIIKKKMGTRYPNDSLILLGSLQEEKLIENMKQSNIYVMASHIENSSNSLCEAMILGMPCIASFAGGTSSLFKDQVEGSLVQSGDPWSLAGTLLDSVNNYKKYISYGENARSRALARHQQEKICRDILQVYHDIHKIETDTKL